MSDTPRIPPPLLENRHIRLKACRHGAMAYNARDIYVGRSLDLYGEYGEEEFRMLDQVLKPGMVALDIGANMGALTIPMAKKVGQTGTVLAFEPQREIFQLLCANASLNALHNIDARHAALGAAAGEILVPPFDYEKGGNFGGIAFGAYEAGERVAALTIDALELTRCHVMKVDVEGMENEVLRGAESTIGRFRPTLYLENDRRERAKELIERLFSMDYVAYWHLPRLFNPDNFFANPENVFDNLVSRNVLALPAEREVKVEQMRRITDPAEPF